MEIYCTTIKVRPAKQHPLFWSIQFAFLKIWLFAEDTQDAADKAGRCVVPMSFEMVGTCVEITKCDLEKYQGTEEYEEKLNQVKEYGFAWFLIACPTGTDEEGFEQKWENEEMA